jgi:hypothetical protein
MPSDGDVSSGEPILALLPAERPWAFDLLSFEEQAWRARVFFAVWINTGGLMFAWAQALRHGPTTPRSRRGSCGT